MKEFNITYNIGQAKYVVNFHDGVQKHRDGSRFFDIQIFKNKKDLAKFTMSLSDKGYLTK